MSIGGSFSGGPNQLLSTLEILGDPDKFNARLSQLREAEESALRAVALVAPANEIQMVRKATEAARQEAADRLVEVEAEVEATRAKAQHELSVAITNAEAARAEAQAFKTRAREEAEAIKSEAAGVRDLILTERAELYAAQANAEKRSAALDALEQELVRRDNELAQREVDLREKATALKKAQAALTAVLGE